MLKKIIDKRNYILLTLIIILFTSIIIINKTTLKQQTKTYNYFNEKITVELYTNKNTNKTFKHINKIFKKYNKYFKNPNKNNNHELIALLKYGKNLYKETNGYIDITSYKLLDSVKNNKKYEFKTKINEINFDDKDTLVNINIENIIAPYVVKKVEKYLKNHKIKSYIIKEDTNIITGKSYNKQKYNIPIFKDNNIIQIVCIENKSIAIKGNINTFKPYMLNPHESSKNKNNKFVVVINDDINKANYLATTIYLLPKDEVRSYVKKYKVAALYYIDDKPLKTKEFKKYEIKT